MCRFLIHLIIGVTLAGCSLSSNRDQSIRFYDNSSRGDKKDAFSTNLDSPAILPDTPTPVPPEIRDKAQAHLREKEKEKEQALTAASCALPYKPVIMEKLPLADVKKIQQIESAIESLPDNQVERRMALQRAIERLLIDNIAKSNDAVNQYIIRSARHYDKWLKMCHKPSEK